MFHWDSADGSTAVILQVAAKSGSQTRQGGKGCYSRCSKVGAPLWAPASSQVALHQCHSRSVPTARVGNLKQAAQPHHQWKKVTQPFISQMGKPRWTEWLIKDMEWIVRESQPLDNQPRGQSVTPQCIVSIIDSKRGFRGHEPFSHQWLLKFALKENTPCGWWSLFLYTASLLGTEISVCAVCSVLPRTRPRRQMAFIQFLLLDHYVSEPYYF